MMSLPCDALRMNSPHKAKQETAPIWPERTAKDRYELNPQLGEFEIWYLRFWSSNRYDDGGLSSVSLVVVLVLGVEEDNNGVERVVSGAEVFIELDIFYDNILILRKVFFGLKRKRRDVED